jgi:hypothetical protein
MNIAEILLNYLTLNNKQSKKNSETTDSDTTLPIFALSKSSMSGSLDLYKKGKGYGV